MMPESPQNIAKRLRMPVDSLWQRLDQMVEKGQLTFPIMKGKKKYILMPFIIGIYEFQLKRLDKEMADLFEEYVPHLMTVLGGNRPALARVIPIHRAIDAKAEILTSENLREMIRQSRSFGLNESICRKERALQGHPCSHALKFQELQMLNCLWSVSKIYGKLITI
jgi:hypothetical protein